MSEDPSKPESDPNETAIIQGFAERILQVLYLMKLSEETRLSIMTTAYINHVKKFLREAPPDFFADAQVAVVMILQQLLEDVKMMQLPKVDDARKGEDGSDATGPIGTTH